MKRRRPSTPSLGMQLECLFRRFPILCGECGYRIEWTEDRDWDHMIEHTDGGAHSAENLRPIHARSIGCHVRKTARKAAERATARQEAKEREQRAAKRRGELTYTSQITKPKWGSRGFQPGHRPMQGRGFEKRRTE